MARHKREAKGKHINPTFFVFCEGESEETYVRYLRNKYRLPVEIATKITRNQVNTRKINESLRYKPRHEKDKIFLMYDIDVPGFLKKLEEIQISNNSELLVSNPCFELWYVLHHHNHTAEISSENCIKKLQESCHSYKKGELPPKLIDKLEKNKEEALKRAKKCIGNNNPSTKVFLFVKSWTK
jgi:hypothetical protein